MILHSIVKPCYDIAQYCKPLQFLRICYACAGKGPIDNLIDHLANPAAINFTTNGVSLPGIPFMQP